MTSCLLCSPGKPALSFRVAAQSKNTSVRHGGRAACSKCFLKLSSTKICTTLWRDATFAARCGARAIQKSNSQFLTVPGCFLKYKLRLVWQAQGFRRVARYLAGAGIREGCDKYCEAWWI